MTDLFYVKNATDKSVVISGAKEKMIGEIMFNRKTKDQVMDLIEHAMDADGVYTIKIFKREDLDD